MIQHDPTTNRLQFILVDSGRNLDRPLVDIKKRHRTATQPLSDSGQRLFGRCGLHSCRGCRQRCNLSLGNVKSLSTSVNICQHFQQFIQLSSNFHPFSHFLYSFPSVSMVLLVYPTMFCCPQVRFLLVVAPLWCQCRSRFFFTRCSCLFNVKIRFSECLECLETFQAGHILIYTAYTDVYWSYNTS